MPSRRYRHSVMIEDGIDDGAGLVLWIRDDVGHGEGAFVEKWRDVRFHIPVSMTRKLHSYLGLLLA